jgi:inner membrane protein
VQKALWLKVVLVGLVALLLQIPTAMIMGLVVERKQTRDGVLLDIARGTGQSQKVAGPVIYVTWTRRSFETITSTDQRDRTNTTRREKVEHGHVALLPADLRIEGRIELLPKQRGIYSAHVYTLNATLRGSFDLPAQFDVPEGPGTLTWGKAALVLGIRDTRGIRNQAVLDWDGAKHPFIPGSMDTADAPSGIQVDLGTLPALKQPQRREFHVELSLLGTERLEIVPVGYTTTVKLVSDWPHPSFGGSILPDAGNQVSPEGFSATWRTSHIATNLGQFHRRCSLTRDCNAFNQQALAVSFIQPVDLYLTVERSVKYGFLFIILTFTGVFLFEVLARLSIHPMQYGLVGIALTMFFLLLISLSEHIGFASAYGIATAACVGLIAYYVGYVLKGWRRAATFALGLASLYGLLYALLRMEDHALLLGSLLVFTCLAAAMIATRRVDWYTLSANTGSIAQKPA